MLHLWSFSLYCHSGSFFFSLLLAPDAMQSWALYNTHSSSQFAVATAKQEMSSISQTKVPLVNIFFGNMIRLNKFPSWLFQNWIFFESPNDRTTSPVIHGFARTMLDSDRTSSSVERPLFQALPELLGRHEIGLLSARVKINQIIAKHMHPKGFALIYTCIK